LVRWRTPATKRDTSWSVVAKLVIQRTVPVWVPRPASACPRDQLGDSFGVGRLGLGIGKVAARAAANAAAGTYSVYNRRMTLLREMIGTFCPDA